MEFNMVHNPMRCPKCNDYGYLKFEVKNVKTSIEFSIELPYYFCDNCSFRFKPINSSMNSVI